jgi:hypothetical protein
MMKREALPPADRWERFAQLQRSAEKILRSSPEGYRRYVQRNLRKRRRHARA